MSRRDQLRAGIELTKQGLATVEQVRALDPTRQKARTSRHPTAGPYYSEAPPSFSQAGQLAAAKLSGAGQSTGKRVLKKVVGAYENLPRWIVRSGQVLVAFIACGLYGAHLNDGVVRANDVDRRWSGFTFAVLVAVTSALTAVVFALCATCSLFCGRMSTHRLFAWDLVLSLLWMILFIFCASLFLKRTDDDGDWHGSSIGAMKTAVWIDLINAVLWLVSGLYGCAKVYAGKKLDEAWGWLIGKIFPCLGSKAEEKNDLRAYDSRV